MKPMFWMCLVCCASVALSYCQSGGLVYTHTWMTKCIGPDECRRQNMVIDGTECLKSCSRDNHFFDNDTRTCYKKCPLDMVVEGHHCISKRMCTNKEQVVLHGACADTCSDSRPLLYHSVCYQQCPSETVANGTLCLPKYKCVHSGNFIFNHTCVRSCPNSSDLVKDSECLSSCPEGSVINRLNCIDAQDCFRMKKVIFNKTCLNDCPTVAPHNITNRCYDHCPSGFVLESSICISDIDCKRKLKVVYEDHCVDLCPTKAPYLVEDENTCMPNCPKGIVKLNMSCISETKCSSLSGLYYFVFNGTCVESCPPSAPLDQNHVCRSQCENNFFKSGASCIRKEDCISSGFIYKRTCVSHCPEDSPFMYDHECLKGCEDDLLYNGSSCIEEYSCNGLIYNRSCVSKCPKNSPIISDRTCLDKCPQETLEDGNRCLNVYDCSQKNGSRFEGKCLEECPPEAPIKSNNKCLRNCTSNCRFVNCDYGEEALSFNGSKCISRKECKEMGMFEHNHTCKSSCPMWTIPRTEPPKNREYIDGKPTTVDHDVCQSVTQLYLGTVLVAAFFIICLIITIRLWHIPCEKVQVGTDKENKQVNPDDDIILEMNIDEENLRLNRVCENSRDIYKKENGRIEREMNDKKRSTEKNKKRKNKRITSVDIHSGENDRQPLLDTGNDGSEDSEMIEV